MNSPTLTSPQLRALFDVLVHHETYDEVKGFRDADAIDHYGYPFSEPPTAKGSADPATSRSSSPLLQLLLTQIILPAPGFNQLPSDFWRERFRCMMMRLADADLSDSYDKGTMGTRKRLATAASVIHEAVTRGILAGVSGGHLPDLHGHYHVKTAEGLTKAWDDSVAHLVHGNLAEELYDKAVETKDFFHDHSPGVGAAFDYALIHLATFCHYIFVLSPEGPYLLKLLESCHRLVPYSVVGQTFRLGNAATMINGMVKLFLAKVSVGAVTNWIGLTKDASDGMNLLQRIISLVLEWDSGNFRSANDKLRKSRDRVSDAYLAVIDAHVRASRKEHDSVREKSIRENKSIIVAILESRKPKLAANISEEHHSQCLEYYAAELAIRDREQLIQGICRQSPDYATAMIRQGLHSFDPMIRGIHAKVDLRKHILSYEKFMNDFIKTAKGRTDKNTQKLSPPTVEDFVSVLQRHCDFPFEYLHDVAKGCPEIRESWCKWAKDSVKIFQQEDGQRNGHVPSTEANSADGSGNMNSSLQNLFGKLPEEDRQRVVVAVDSHVEYLNTIEGISNQRMQHVIDNRLQNKSTGNMSGPGVYLSSWQSLLDTTTITPNTTIGTPRHGKNVKGMKASGKTEATPNQDGWDPEALLEEQSENMPEAPDVSVIVEKLQPWFKDLVADISREGLFGKA